jgi:hypothetical protein
VGAYAPNGFAFTLSSSSGMRFGVRWAVLAPLAAEDPRIPEGIRIGGEGRNWPYFPAVAPQICLILLAIQAKSVLSDHIVFNPFGVRFGVRLI